VGQIIAVAGYGEYFPWSIPALYAQGDELGAISFVIVGVIGIVGVVATFLWWEMADQTQ
jgi:ABC-2 type transport system permease protein